jgi:predicted alpha/beta hydrolase family esterase
MKRVIIVHGWQSTPQDGWKPWLKQELQAAGFEVSIPIMPQPDRPHPGGWVQKLARTIRMPDSDTYFVGHSLGCIAILRYLEVLESPARVGGAVFVAGFASDLTREGYKDELALFFSQPINWAHVRRHTGRIIAINSDNDPWVAPENLKVFADKLGAETHLMSGMGHFGQSELPEVRDAVLELARLRPSKAGRTSIAPQ